ncbi:MAG TPA: hypothetical protein VKX46_12185, partial [Ktedonobacteraceae bacterium]|nr:hypothetical protein [Ktedonobacteraceae bacterium]
MFKKTRIAFPILLVLSLIALFVVSGSAMAHSSRPNGAKSAKAQDFLTGDVTAYVVHGIPGIPVDVYVNGQLALSNFQPGST